MRRPPIRPALIVALAAGGCADPPPPLLSTLPEPVPLMSHQSFCDTVFGAPRRHLEARCSPADKAGRAYGTLVARAGRRVDQCLVDTQLAPSVETGRAQLLLEAALRCATALEQVSWKTTLVSDDLTRFPACRDLVVGVQGDRAACSSSYDCLPGLWCTGQKGGSTGRCLAQVAVGQPCEPLPPTLFGTVPTSCRGGAYCRAGDHPGLPGQAPRRHAVRAADGGPLPAAARQEVLRQGEKLGVIAIIKDQPTPAGVWAGLDAAFGLAAREGPAGWTLGLGGMGEPVGVGQGGFGGRKPDAVAGGGSPDAAGAPRHGAGVGRPDSARAGGRPKVRLGELSVSGRLPKEVVQRVLRQHLGRFAACYEQGLEREPNLEGRVAVRLAIGREGAVTSVGTGGDLPDPTVATCLSNVVQTIRFPAPEGGIVTVGVPIELAPPPGSGTAPAPATAGSPSASTAARVATPAEPRYEQRAAGPAVAPSLCTRWQSLGAPCTATVQCAAGMACRGGKCSKPRLGRAGDECGVHGDCRAGLYCAGTCKQARGEGEACTTAAECRGACGADGKCVALCGEG